MNQIVDSLERGMRSLFTNPYTKTAIIVFLLLYASVLPPALPQNLAVLLQNPVVKVLLLILFLMLYQYDGTVAILSAVGFVIVLQLMSQSNLNYYMTGGNAGAAYPLDNREVAVDVPAPYPESEQGVQPIEADVATVTRIEVADPVLPPQPAIVEEVGTVFENGGPYMGPQGLQYPQGYSVPEVGASYNVTA